MSERRVGRLARRWSVVLVVAAVVLAGCGLGQSGRATLTRRHTSSAPLPQVADVPAVARLLESRRIRCDALTQAAPPPTDRATNGGCVTDGGVLNFSIYAADAPMPAPQGPVCRGPGSPEGIDGMKVVFEARGANFRIMGAPPPEVAKSAIPVKELWVRSTRITTEVGTAAGLDLMEFTVHCTRGFP